jgi:signal transduction histidine kinase/CheY-like chemotaxis protein
MTATRCGTESRPVFLSTAPARQGEKRLAWIVAIASLLASLVGLPFVRTPLPQVPAFIPSYEAALWINDTITAVLLFSQFSRLRSGAMLLLAAGYLFDSLMIVPHVLSFPGVFSPTGLLGAGPQTTPWLYVFWHAGFPFFVLAYALRVRRSGDLLRIPPGRAIGVAIVLVVGLVVGLTLLTTVGQHLLPPLIREGAYSQLLARGFSPILSAIGIAVLLVLWLRGAPTVLDLWLMVVMLSWSLDTGFSVVVGGTRYDFGFYAGRAYGLLAASFVLGVLLVETHRLYSSLADALDLAETRNVELARSREEFARVQRSEAIGQLVGGVAHDFNNLLTVITGGLELMLREPDLSSRGRRLVGSSMKAAQRGAQLTQQLLTFARKQVLRPEVLNPNEMIASLQAFVSPATGEQVDVVTQLSPVVWPVRLDRTEFETALVNLVLNARDAIDGEGRIVIATRNVVVAAGTVPELPAGDYALVSVTDAGCGMAPEDCARAFEPFFTTKEVGKGSGLGLSQVYGFVRGAAGHVRIDSKLGEGTTVELYLPKSAELPAQPEQIGMMPIRAAKGHETVLVVEDDPDVLNVAVSGLRELGYDVKTASDAREALAILRSDPSIDVLFSDVVMPGGMNGAQLAREAQRLRGNLKVLLTSGYTASALTQEHGLPEQLDVLRKPYRREELASRLRVVIGEKSA